MEKRLELSPNFPIEIISAVIILFLLVVFCILDIKNRIIKNKLLIIPYLIGLIKLCSKFLFYNEFNLNFIYYYAFYFLIIILMYKIGFFGGADVKIGLIIFLIYQPTNSFGFTDNYDGIQFIYYLILTLIFIHCFNLMKNLYVKRKKQYIFAFTMNFII